jgi:FkbM family methyltransferase
MRLPSHAGVDVEHWGVRMRLYPHGNICEKTALFTPQMFDAAERAELVREIEASRAEGRRFSFVDIGANVGLYSLFVASASEGHADIIAVEPEPTSLARLRFHAAANPWASISIQPVALGERRGTVALEINRNNRGGTRTRPATAADRVVVPCMSLIELLSCERTERIDALKIDVEGLEQEILGPFFRDAPRTLWPRMIIIEADSKSPALAEVKERGYRIVARTRANFVLLGGAS